MRCNIEEEAHNQSCIFVQTCSGHESRTGIVWEVPCGIEEHSGVVSVVRFVSAAVSALFIVLAAIHYSDICTDLNILYLFLGFLGILFAEWFCCVGNIF